MNEAPRDRPVVEEGQFYRVEGIFSVKYRLRGRIDKYPIRGSFWEMYLIYTNKEGVLEILEDTPVHLCMN